MKLFVLGPGIVDLPSVVHLSGLSGIAGYYIYSIVRLYIRVFALGYYRRRVYP